MPTSRPSVHLGFCHTGTVYTPFMLSILAWERYEVQTNGRLPAYSAVKHVIIGESRNQLARQFLDTDSEWLWVLDPDIQFQPDTLDRLLAVADPQQAPIVAAAYWNEYDGGKRCLTWHAATKEGLRLFRKLPGEQVIVLGSCGMGCTLIHRSVFEKLQKKFRHDPWPWFGHDVIQTSNGTERAGEDVTFCVRARKAGFRVVGHCGVTVEHYKPHQMAHGEVSG